MPHEPSIWEIIASIGTLAAVVVALASPFIVAYLRKCQQDIDLIQEITADKILWVSSNGIERTLNFSSFKTRFSTLKKELFEEIED